MEFCHAAGLYDEDDHLTITTFSPEDGRPILTTKLTKPSQRKVASSAAPAADAPRSGARTLKRGRSPSPALTKRQPEESALRAAAAGWLSSIDAQQNKFVLNALTVWPLTLVLLHAKHSTVAAWLDVGLFFFSFMNWTYEGDSIASTIYSGGDFVFTLFALVFFSTTFPDDEFPVAVIGCLAVISCGVSLLFNCMANHAAELLARTFFRLFLFIILLGPAMAQNGIPLLSQQTMGLVCCYFMHATMLVVNYEHVRKHD